MSVVINNLGDGHTHTKTLWTKAILGSHVCTGLQSANAWYRVYKLAS